MSLIRGLAKLAINRWGYEIRRAPSRGKVHFAKDGSDPVTFEYLPRQRGYTIFGVLIEDVRAFDPICLPLTETLHPFVPASLAALEVDESPDTQVAGILDRYYAKVQPVSALDVLDLEPADAPGLVGAAPTDYVMPWAHVTPDEIRNSRQRVAAFEGLQNGFSVDPSDGMTTFGPVKSAKLAMEALRISRLARSVKTKGFLGLGGREPLQVCALRRDKECRWLVQHGQHRFAMAAALGIEKVPAQVTQVIRREDAAYWPNVVNGSYTAAGAEKLFDRLFAGTPARVAAAWISARLDTAAVDHL